MAILELETEKVAACEPILRALPQWFGIEAAIGHYLEDIARERTWVATSPAGYLGFLTVVYHNPYTAEIHVMGVLPEHHRAGLGARLVAAVEASLVADGYEYLAVKTLSPAHPDPHYAKTRAFYTARGFRPVQELPALWGPENPCLLMIKRLDGASPPVKSRKETP